VFIDPPYYSQLEDDYEGMAKGSYGHYIAVMSLVFNNSYNALKPGGFLCVLIAPMSIKTDFVDISYDFTTILKENFTIIKKISVPVGSQQVAPHEVKKCKDDKTMVALYRELLVFKKDRR
jgi:DNA modification methylase